MCSNPPTTASPKEESCTGDDYDYAPSTEVDNDIEANNNNNITGGQANNTEAAVQEENMPKEIIENEADQQQEVEVEREEKPSFSFSSCWSKCVAFYRQNEFLLLVVAVILLARAYPPLGAEYLHPEITATWIAVCFIFFMAGLGLKTSEFTSAIFQRLGFNLFVQVFNLGLVSAFVYLISRALAASNILSQGLANGMVVAASLPMTINMVCVLTKASGGHEGLAIVNAAAGNLMGVFISPILILGYLGKTRSSQYEESTTEQIDVMDIFFKLALRVLLPVFVGQLVQKTCPPAVAFHKAHKPWFKKAQEYALVFIVYTVFCRTFSNPSNSSSIGDIFLMIVFVFLCLVALMVLAWYTLNLIWKNEPTLCVMGLFGCTHKTVAMGIPLINAIFENDSAIGLYTLPLLIWHPMQLVIGTFLAPRLSAYVDRRQEEIKAAAADATTEPTAGTSNADDDSMQQQQQHERDQTSSNRIQSGDKDEEAHDGTTGSNDNQAAPDAVAVERDPETEVSSPSSTTTRPTGGTDTSIEEMEDARRS